MEESGINVMICYLTLISSIKMAIMMMEITVLLGIDMKIMMSKMWLLNVLKTVAVFAYQIDGVAGSLLIKTMIICAALQLVKETGKKRYMCICISIIPSFIKIIIYGNKNYELNLYNYNFVNIELNHFISGIDGNLVLGVFLINIIVVLTMRLGYLKNINDHLLSFDNNKHKNDMRSSITLDLTVPLDTQVPINQTRYNDTNTILNQSITTRNTRDTITSDSSMFANSAIHERDIYNPPLEINTHSNDNIYENIRVYNNDLSDDFFNDFNIPNRQIEYYEPKLMRNDLQNLNPIDMTLETCKSDINSDDTSKGEQNFSKKRKNTFLKDRSDAAKKSKNGIRTKDKQTKEADIEMKELEVQEEKTLKRRRNTSNNYTSAKKHKFDHQITDTCKFFDCTKKDDHESDSDSDNQTNGDGLNDPISQNSVSPTCNEEQNTERENNNNDKLSTNVSPFDNTVHLDTAGNQLVHHNLGTNDLNMSSSDFLNTDNQPNNMLSQDEESHDLETALDDSKCRNKRKVISNNTEDNCTESNTDNHVDTPTQAIKKFKGLYKSEFIYNLQVDHIKEIFKV
ncbi:hypothetical protein EON71_00970 [bacterium]|nr:MAG: hypothetical protein EON71_00970 [bacterium]